MPSRPSKNDLIRLEALMQTLLKSFDKLPNQENLPSDMVLSAIANAAAKFAAGRGISVERYLEIQAAMIMIETERTKQ